MPNLSKPPALRRHPTAVSLVEALRRHAQSVWRALEAAGQRRAQREMARFIVNHPELARRSNLGA